MGGYGSGRSGWRVTVGRCLALDISYLQRKGYLWGKGANRWLHWKHSSTGEDAGSFGFEVDRYEKQLELMYSFVRDDGRQDITQLVLLDTTTPYFGGLRYWAICPACDRRCRVLFLPPGQTYFRCRECYNLTYESSNESRKYQSLFRRIALEAGLPFETVKQTLTGWKREGRWGW